MSVEPATQCDAIQPWLAAHALGEADEDPAPLAHLAACPQCQRDLREYRLVAGALPYGAPEQAPAPELRAKVIAAVAGAAGVAAPAAQAAPPARQAAPVRRLFGARAGWAALAFAALAIALLGWNVTLQRRINQQSTQIASNRQSWQTMIVLLNDQSLQWFSLAGTQANGHFWSTPRGQTACLVAQQLPQLAAGQVYQVWLARGGEQSSAGTFEARDGNGWVLIRADEPIADYDTVFVTVEPGDGSPAPAGPRVIGGSLAIAGTPSLAERQQVLRLLGDAAGGQL